MVSNLKVNHKTQQNLKKEIVNVLCDEFQVNAQAINFLDFYAHKFALHKDSVKKIKAMYLEKKNLNVAMITQVAASI